MQKWLSIPIPKNSNKKKIREVFPSTEASWRAENLSVFNMAYKDAPFYADALRLVCDVMESGIESDESLASISEKTTRVLAEYLGLDEKLTFMRSSEMDIPGKGSDRVLAVCKHLGASEYITAHGASKYLDHESFDQEDIDVKYIEYSLQPYLQLSSDFNPYVSSLDMIANVGPGSRNLLSVESKSWREFILSRDSAKEDLE
jgi:hypothetical protein